ncbi:MAG: multicopper oxidase domain-containing protein [Myxococcota bacterium]|nr:multicopper oxidase domain-containing protein [Myxococcota bacterium]
MSISRRDLMKAGATTVAASAAGLPALTRMAHAKGRRDKRRQDKGQPTESSSLYDPSKSAFTRELPIPAVLRDKSGGLSPGPGKVFHGIAPEFSRTHPDYETAWNMAALRVYEMVVEQNYSRIIPGVDTPVFTYRDANDAPGTGGAPGPTIFANFNEPAVVRFTNRLEAKYTYVEHDIELSTHLHGGHSPAHSDGSPAFYILPGRSRDYFYPNASPRRLIDGKLRFDPGTIASTMWYHDHAMDITGFTVCHGLAGFYLMLDELEAGLMDGPYPLLPDLRCALDQPDECFDVPIVLSDQKFNADGTLAYDLLDHNGRIGDVFVVNGVAQPFFRVQRRKYRFRILNGSNARYYTLRLGSGSSFLRIGTDSWLLPEAFAMREISVCPGQRADVIVDFRDAPDEVFLENIMQQTDGRKPDGIDRDKATPLLKFVVEGPNVAGDVGIAQGTQLRPFDPIREEDIVGTRVFEFKRRRGAWVVNHEFFNPLRADAEPTIDPTGCAAERWILKNGGGGWFHPIHIHLEHHEVQRIDGKRPNRERSTRVDLTNLEGGQEAEVFLRFRTFTGPFVFHCHIIEHEDLRMMAQFDPCHPGYDSPLDGVSEIDPAVCGVPIACDDLEPTLFFDTAGDVAKLDGHGVGIHCEYEPLEED